MPRTARSIDSNYYYHALNRGNGRMTLFHKPADFDAFVRILADGVQRYPVDLLAWCVMSNHWHLVVRPRKDDALGRLLGWVGVTHVRRHHAHYHSTGGGHLYQGRFKSFPVQEDRHFLTLCRYVEANPVRAGLVDTAEEWKWSSLSRRSGGVTLPLAKWPVDRPRHWRRLVNAALPEPEAHSIRTCIARDRPLGEGAWVEQVARRLGLEYSLRPRGRPRKEKKE